MGKIVEGLGAKRNPNVTGRERDEARAHHDGYPGNVHGQWGCCDATFQSDTHGKCKYQTAPPLCFQQDQYRRWEEELYFWREIHSYSDENTLIAELALSSTESIRATFVSFIRRTKENQKERTFGNLLMFLGAEFRKDSAERESGQSNAPVQHLLSREAAEAIRSFRIRFQEMIDDIRMSGLKIADNMAYVRAMQALILSDTRRMAILAGMSQAQNPYCPKALKEMATRLLPTQIETSDILTQECVGNEDGLGDSPDAYLAQNKSRNRPGMEWKKKR